MVRFRSTKDLFKRTQRMVEDGGMPRPRWLDPFLEMQQMPNNTISTGEEPVRPEKAPKQRFPEDIFYLDFLQRHPEAKYEAVDLSSSDPPTARRYAWAQLAYMNQGMSVSAARRAADKDFADELSKQQKVPSVLQLVQQQEEGVLLRAMQQHREQPVKQDAWLAKDEESVPDRPQPELQPYRTAIRQEGDVSSSPAGLRKPAPGLRKDDLWGDDW